MGKEQVVLKVHPVTRHEGSE